MRVNDISFERKNQDLSDYECRTNLRWSDFEQIGVKGNVVKF